MEPAKRTIHKEGLDRDPLAAVCEAEQCHNDGEEQRAGPEGHLGTDGAPKKVTDEAQAEPEGLASADLGSGVFEHSEGLSENAVTSDLDCDDIEGSKPDDHGEPQNLNLQDRDDGATPNAEASNPLHEHDDIASFGAGDSTLESDSRSTVHHHDSHSNCNTPNLGLSAEESEKDAQIDSESDDDAEFLAKIARFELPNGPPPLQLNYEALKHLATYFLPGSHGRCIDVTKVWGGSFHEIRILTFEDGWTCIGRFASLYEPLFKTEAELATIAYVRKHTQIPAPAIYFVNHNENHVVGAAFVLLERVPGVRLFDIWSDLSMEHRLSVVKQVADIVGELADLRFDRIGSLTFDGTVGPLVNISYTEDEALAGPFNNFIDFAYATMDETRRHNSEEALAIYPTIKDELRNLLASGILDPMLQAPYRLIHVDLEDRNIMVTRESEQHPPKISGIIDWDHAFVGPSYYLYEHIGLTTELQKEEEELPDLKKLRQHFAKTLVQRHARNSPERGLIRQCFKEKSIELTKLLTFAKFPLDSDSFSSMLKTYLDSFDHENENGDRHPYDVFHKDWVPDSDTESDG
ncbi:hypothetical protein MBLNU13_g07551t1 [Cladosporium sp. NU13]